jgi:hypothetical protein
MEAAATPLQRSEKRKSSAHIARSLKDLESRARVKWKKIKIAFHTNPVISC